MQGTINYCAETLEKQKDLHDKHMRIVLKQHNNY